MEVVNSFFSNIKDKLTNPFFGTLILVLIVHHWELIYSIFNFDDGSTLDKKLFFIQNYISENITFKTLLWDFLYAFCYMTIGYLIVVGTRSLVLAIEFRLMPFLTGKIVSKNVVKKSLYDEVVKEREDYFDQYEEQRKNVRDFSKTIDQQNEQIKEKDKDLVKQSQTISKNVKELDSLNKTMESLNQNLGRTQNQLKSQKNEFDNLSEQHAYLSKRVENYDSLFFDSKNVGHYTTAEMFPPEIIDKVLELKRENLWHSFLALGDFKRHGGTLGGELMTKMAEKGIIGERVKNEQWTPIGKIIDKYRAVLGNIKSR